MLVLTVTLALGMVSAFVPPASLQQVSRVRVSPADVTMFMGSGKSSAKKAGDASSTKPKVTNKAKPLSPGSNYPSTKNIQTQQSGFGAFLQKFQTVTGKSKYEGIPIFLKNGNVNPAYLAAERKEAQAQSKKNQMTAEVKRKGLISKKDFELADYVRKRVGNVGSGKDYYQSGR